MRSSIKNNFMALFLFVLLSEKAKKKKHVLKLVLNLVKVIIKYIPILLLMTIALFPLILPNILCKKENSLHIFLYRK